MAIDDMKKTLKRLEDTTIIDTDERSIEFKTEQGNKVRTKVVESLNRQNIVQSNISYSDGVWTVEIDPR